MKHSCAPIKKGESWCFVDIRLGSPPDALLRKWLTDSCTEVNLMSRSCHAGIRLMIFLHAWFYLILTSTCTGSVKKHGHCLMSRHWELGSHCCQVPRSQVQYLWWHIARKVIPWSSFRCPQLCLCPFPWCDSSRWLNVEYWVAWNPCVYTPKDIETWAFQPPQTADYKQQSIQQDTVVLENLSIEFLFLMLLQALYNYRMFDTLTALVLA